MKDGTGSRAQCERRLTSSPRANISPLWNGRRLHPARTLRPWAGEQKTLCLRLLICKMGTVMVPAADDTCEDEVKPWVRSPGCRRARC